MDTAVEIEIADPRWSQIVGPDADSRLAPALAAVFAEAPQPAQHGIATLILGDDRMVAALNRDYRGRDAPTNVLSFPLWDGAPGAAEPAPPVHGPAGSLTLGDVYVAWETAVAEADRDGKGRFEHLCHLVVHGMLHLLGFDHQDDADAEIMEGLERRALARLGIDDPYAPRADDVPDPPALATSQ